MLRFFAIASLLPLLAGADWPVSRGTPAATGIGETTIDGELKIVWEFKTKNAIEGTPAIIDGVVYVGSTDKNVYAISLATGQQIWKQPVQSPVRASVSVRDGRVYVGTVDGVFFCLDAKDGQPKWQFNADQEIVSGCNFHSDKILVGSNDGNLYCLTADNKLVWKFGIDQPINGMPSVAGDLSFVAGCDEIFDVVVFKTGK
jgi:outer membrane protein assembly factor BamB